MHLGALCVFNWPKFFKVQFWACNGVVNTIIRSTTRWYEEGENFRKCHEILSKYQPTLPWTQYYGQINAIPAECFANLKDATERTVQNTFTAHNQSTSCRYSFLLKRVFPAPTAENKILRYGTERNTLQKVYGLAFVVPKGINLKMLQCKVIHNVLPTRSSLLRYGIVGNYVMTKNNPL